jgi:hypothetical protein
METRRGRLNAKSKLSRVDPTVLPIVVCRLPPWESSPLGLQFQLHPNRFVFLFFTPISHKNAPQRSIFIPSALAGSSSLGGGLVPEKRKAGDDEDEVKIKAIKDLAMLCQDQAVGRAWWSMMY